MGFVKFVMSQTSLCIAITVQNAHLCLKANCQVRDCNKLIFNLQVLYLFTKVSLASDCKHGLALWKTKFQPR